jgi:hypothetical protein
VSHFFTQGVKLSLVVCFLVWLSSYLDVSLALGKFILLKANAVGPSLASLRTYLAYLLYRGYRDLYLGDLCVYVTGQANVFNFFFFS